MQINGITGDTLLTGNEEMLTVANGSTGISGMGAATLDPLYLTTAQILLLHLVAHTPGLEDIRMRYEITQNFRVFQEELAERLKVSPYAPPTATNK